MDVRIPIIKVKDKQGSAEHIVGTNSHDQLIIENNAVHYLNIQCMEGTRYGGSYEFIGIEGNEYEPETTIEFVSLEEFAELYSNIFKEQIEDEKRLQGFLQKVRADEEAFEKLQNDKGYIWHT